MGQSICKHAFQVSTPIDWFSLSISSILEICRCCLIFSFILLFINLQYFTTLRNLIFAALLWAFSLLQSAHVSLSKMWVYTQQNRPNHCLIKFQSGLFPILMIQSSENSLASILAFVKFYVFVLNKRYFIL